MVIPQGTVATRSARPIAYRPVLCTIRASVDAARPKVAAALAVDHPGFRAVRNALDIDGGGGHDRVECDLDVVAVVVRIKGATNLALLIKKKASVVHWGDWQVLNHR